MVRGTYIAVIDSVLASPRQDREAQWRNLEKTIGTLGFSASQVDTVIERAQWDVDDLEQPTLPQTWTGTL